MRLLLDRIKADFELAAWRRGEGYQRQRMVKRWKVAASNDTSLTIESEVRGSYEGAYDQQIVIALDRRTLTIEGECSCPVGFNCKHVAAVMIEATPRIADQLSGLAGLPAPDEDDGAGERELPYVQARPAHRRPGSDANAPLPRDINIWLDRLASAYARSEDPNTYPDGVPERIVYAINCDRNAGGSYANVRAFQVRMRQDGSYSKPQNYSLSQLAVSNARGVLPIDREIGQLAALAGLAYFDARIEGAYGPALLDRLIDSGRCYFGAPGKGSLLRKGGTRTARTQWNTDAKGTQRCTLAIEPPAQTLLPLAPPYYVDTANGECGPVDIGLPAGLAELLAQAPPVPVEAAAVVERRLRALAPDGALPAPRAITTTRRNDVRPIPVLELFTVALEPTHVHFGGEHHGARLSFRYGDKSASLDDSAEVRSFSGIALELIERNRKAEQAAIDRIHGAGFVEVERRHGWGLPRKFSGALTLHDDAQWIGFARETLPKLRAEGWQIEIAPGFAFDIAEIDAWYGEIDDAGESGADWFGFDIAIEVGGARFSMVDIVVKTLHQRGRYFFGAGMPEADLKPVLLPLPDGRRVVLAPERLKPILSTLHELFAVDALGNPDKRLSRFDVARLADLDAQLGLRWMGGERLREIASRLADFRGIEKVAPPSGLRATLRPYQQLGLDWLQFLRAFDLAGVLADDMGLGKTLQTLAHILCEKASGRLDAPALVVAPTSVIGNWMQETARFAPGLSVLDITGKTRAERFAEIARADIVLTSYALLPRDAATLKSRRWHLLVLDEAQYIKNPKTKAAQAACAIEARHRLCLSGTPLENHLGELWSLFHFLMPGFLGDDRQFKRRYRTPIETHGNAEIADLLARRVRPFLLRRTKAQVERELPPKTEMVRKIGLDGAQRDIYETVRAAMDKRVRDEIARLGLARSQIIVLDALLKLRQICCDPRLLKRGASDAPARTKTTATTKRPPADMKAVAPGASAKLDLLLEMLDELLEEGRRVLLFSQFTSMLALIEPELAERDIDYVKLTGDTVDRATPVRRFQKGEVALFLLSLKAGGVGLNLTAADTVIHYDPWWNPAAEVQATDRAYRIGQDKPVFVYKLIAQDTVEEKILQLQEKKGRLAKSLLEGDGALARLSAEELLGLFSPLH